MPETIVRCLDQMYRTGVIDLVDARVLRLWGDRGRAPLAGGSVRSDWHHWRYALTHLELTLRAKGIVAGFEIVAPTSPETRRREKILSDDRINFLFAFPTKPTPPNLGDPS